jgi:hypothetical protein
MSRRPPFTLTPRQRRALARVRDRHPQPHLREKAGALLTVADGWAIRDVAAFGLLRRRCRHAVAGWLRRYEARGLAGLRVAQGRGRQPAFSPLGADAAPGPGPAA